eukprot:1182083-Prorocentrum_minimum.AAC.3
MCSCHLAPAGLEEGSSEDTKSAVASTSFASASLETTPRYQRSVTLGNIREYSVTPSNAQ